MQTEPRDYTLTHLFFSSLLCTSLVPALKTHKYYSPGEGEKKKKRKRKKEEKKKPQQHFRNFHATKGFFNTITIIHKFAHVYITEGALESLTHPPGLFLPSRPWWSSGGLVLAMRLGCAGVFVGWGSRVCWEALMMDPGYGCNGWESFGPLVWGGKTARWGSRCWDWSEWVSFWGTLRWGDAGDMVGFDDTTGMGMTVIGMEGAGGGGEDRADGGAWLRSGLSSSPEVRWLACVAWMQWGTSALRFPASCSRRSLSRSSFSSTGKS